jgi:hypothetical protein
MKNPTINQILDLIPNQKYDNPKSASEAVRMSNLPVEIKQSLLENHNDKLPEYRIRKFISLHQFIKQTVDDFNYKFRELCEILSESQACTPDHKASTENQIISLSQALDDLVKDVQTLYRTKQDKEPDHIKNEHGYDEDVARIVTTERLDQYVNFVKANEHTWVFTFFMNGDQTLFRVVKQQFSYIIYISQRRDSWENTICFGKVTELHDLHALFHSLTRGETLKIREDVA